VLPRVCAVEIRQSPDGVENSRDSVVLDALRVVVPKGVSIGVGKAIVTVVEPL